MTPFEIDILLHYATTRGDHPLIFNPPPIWRETIDRFLELGLLESSSGVAGDTCYAKTARLDAYAEALQRVPLPVQQWVTPNAKLTGPSANQGHTDEHH